MLESPGSFKKHWCLGPTWRCWSRCGHWALGFGLVLWNFSGLPRGFECADKFGNPCSKKFPCASSPLPSPPRDKSLLWFFLPSISFPCSRISFKWNHIVHTLVCKASFTQRGIHLCCHWISSLFLSNASTFYDYSTTWLSILLLIDTWLVSTFVPLWIKLPWIFLYVSFCRHVFSLLLG